MTNARPNSDLPVSSPLRHRLVACPVCDRKQLTEVEDLLKPHTCNCGAKFRAEEHIVTEQDSSITNCYSSWLCPHCSRNLLIPRFATSIPARCPCGFLHPTANTKPNHDVYRLDAVETAFYGNDPQLSDNLLISFRAAKKYDYELVKLSECRFQLRNPKKGTKYVVQLTPAFDDECECDVFQAGGGSCIHIEHARLKLGWPSTAQAFAEQSEFAYAWLDKTSLPARIRIGWSGKIAPKVKLVAANHGAVTTLDDLSELTAAFRKLKINFRVLSSAKLAIIENSEFLVDETITEKVSIHGRAFLHQTIPHLHPFQVEGAVFLAQAQRALLLDEMGLGKTIQAIAAARLLQNFANAKSCLILAPKSALKHWQKEILQHLDMHCEIIDGTRVERAMAYRDSNFFKVTTLESFRVDFLHVGHHDVLVVDEIHKARNFRSVSNRVLRTANSKFLFGLSGTAIESSLEDLYSLLRIIRPARLESPISFYASHVVCNDFGKMKHTLHPEFFYIRNSHRILRRCKSETSTGIPPIVISHVDLSLTNAQKEMADPLMAELKLLSERLKLKHERDDFIRHRWLINRLVELSNSTAMLGSGSNSSSKLEWLKELLREQCIDREEKVVVFTRWVRSQALIVQVCTMLGLKCAILNGQTATLDRERAIDSFMQSSDVNVFVSTDAGGIGVNLQNSRILVNFEPAWNPSTDAQRIQRVHRIGQHRNVYVYLPLTILDYMFALSTHSRKSLAINCIDAMRTVRNDESVVSWEELLPVIAYLQDMVSS